MAVGNYTEKSVGRYTTGYLIRGIAKRLEEINSPLPRLIGYRYTPLAGERIRDKHERL